MPRGAALVVAALVLIAGCDLLEEDKGNGDSKTELGPYTQTEAVEPSPVTTSASRTVDVVAEIPDDSQSMGMVVIGTDAEWKFIEHEDVFGVGGDIRGPDGAVPLSFATINDEPLPAAIGNEAGSVNFPNDGTSVTLPAGTYRFPVGAACDDLPPTPCAGGNYALYADTLNPVVYYKTATSQQPTLKFNVVVLPGVSPDITTAAEASADAEVLGAVEVLRNVFERNSLMDLDVEVSVDVGAGCGYDATPDIVDDASEYLCLLSSYPNPAQDDALNIYVVTSLDYLPANVIGLDPSIPGPFLLQGLMMSGAVAEYQADGEGTILGYILAHEFGHYLGLFHTSQTDSDATGIIGYDPIDDTDKCQDEHVEAEGGIDNCPDRENLMFPYVQNTDDPDFSSGQANVMRYNPAVTP